MKKLLFLLPLLFLLSSDTPKECYKVTKVTNNRPPGKFSPMVIKTDKVISVAAFVLVMPTRAAPVTLVTYFAISIFIFHFHYHSYLTQRKPGP